MDDILSMIKFEDKNKNLIKINHVSFHMEVKSQREHTVQKKKPGATNTNSKGISHKCGKHYYVWYYVTFYYAVLVCCNSFLLSIKLLFVGTEFTPSISVIRGKSRNPNFPWGSGFSERANDKWPNKYRKYEKTTKQIYRKSRSLIRICVRAWRLFQKIIKASAARAVSDFPSSSHQKP